MSRSTNSGAPRSGAEALLRRLEWTALRRLDGVLQGDYRTLFRGFGLDLADLREYQYGDDVRHIDWNVTARLDTPYVRQYHEDREITAWFLVDLSGSIDFGSRETKKQQVATQFVALLARLLTRRGNRVGAILYGSSVDTVIPARSGRRHLLQILHRMQERPASLQPGETKLADLLSAGANAMSRRSVVFVLSDFISAPGWTARLGQLALRHEVVAVRLHDPLESELPDLGLLLFRDAETGEQLFVDTHDPAFRKRFAAAAAKREESLRASFRESGVDAMELSTEADLVEEISRFIELRRRRSRSNARAVA
jgi:uncharacterized protein (DUF58 family)